MRDEQSIVEVAYCEGWDAARREPVGSIPAPAARLRDEAGEQYAVLLSVAGEPKALFHVAWAHHYVGVFLFDGCGRREREFDYRLVDAPDVLRLRYYTEWRYAEDGQPEFAADAWRYALDVQADGRTYQTLDDMGSGGGAAHTAVELPDRWRAIPKAQFGAWDAYIDARVLGVAEPIALADAPERPAVEPDPRGAPWTGPTGLRPWNLEALFTAGALLKYDDGDVAVVSEPEHAGILRLPSGSVIAADPGWLGKRNEPFTVSVPAGDYPVQIARIKWRTKGWGEITAAKLVIRDEPPATWELALLPGQDARMLRGRAFYGFGVDTGSGAFLDAVGRDALAAAFKAGLESELAAADPAADGAVATWVRDAATGTNLVAYPGGRGDGSYPVWIGRDADGAVTGFVADMLILNRAELLLPATPSAARHIIAPPTGGGRPDAVPDRVPPHQLSRLIDVLNAMAAGAVRSRS
jgi:hypothetical protein